MKNRETIDVIEMSDSELAEISGGVLFRGTKDIALLIYYITVVTVPSLFFT